MPAKMSRIQDISSCVYGSGEVPVNEAILPGTQDNCFVRCTGYGVYRTSGVLGQTVFNFIYPILHPLGFRFWLCGYERSH